MTRAPVTIRASSVGSLIDCPKRFVAIHLEGRSVPSSGKAALGTAVHHGTALYDSEKLAGHEASIEAAAQAAAESVKRPREEVDWSDENQADAEGIAASLTRRYCTLIAPVMEYAAVEATVESLLIEDLGIVLTGTTDRIRVVRDARDGPARLGIVDVKTGKAAVNAAGHVETKGHAAQLGVYELIAQAAIGAPIEAPAAIVGLQTNKTADKQRVGVGEVSGARDVLVGDADNPGLLEIAARILHGDLPAWGNPKSTLCNPRFCPVYNQCLYRK